MKKNNIVLVISIVFAIILGLAAPDFINSIDFIGNVYINLLKFMIFPIIFTSIMVTTYESKKIKNSMLFKIILTFIIMFIVSFLITSIIMLLLKPANNYSYNFIDWNEQITNITFSQIVVNLFPSNIVTMIQNNSIFSMIIFALLCGFAACKVKNGKEVIKIVEGIKDISYKVLEYILYLTPVAIISLLGGAIANYGKVILGIGAKYILVVYLCSFIVMLLVMILPVWIIAKINPIIYIKKLLRIWVMTITTCSSAATLPTTIKVCNDELKIPSKLTNITVPLGCTIHMCGGAVSFAILGLFCFQLFGIELTLYKFLIMIFSATVINMAAPGIPNGGVVIGATYLSLLGLPLTFIGFYSSIYKLLDMSYTTLNVTGDVTANVILNKICYNK